ncbi:Zinc finger, RING/FYVE/PHD-type [Lasallia pustulata]|uniref:Chromatin modification-related protein n=1 Tax=Lasallia pustulata TaxID=136370 RepID=A0A1W5DDY9_9LECA|nr:Zinc finger, RING/FYVE/PHD-type [Lasallia pustulata]
MATAPEPIAEAPVDPDAQATVTDFLDYTEYLPSDLIRSLTLIRKLDETYLTSTDNVHELSKTYGCLPKVPTDQRLSPQLLRQQISQSLDYGIRARESSYAEACRVYDVVDRHYNRLTSIISKLHALPKPPSRDPTPAPQLSSPQASRVRTGRKGDIDGTPPPRITLRLDGARAAAASNRTPGSGARQGTRIRKITVPGEVLPPPNPDSPPPTTDSDWESVPPSPIPMPTSRVGAPSRSRSIKPAGVKVPKPPKPPKIKVPKTPRPPRPPGTMGTNVHSAVAGISTSNALSLLSPPPPDAKPGSIHAPWMRLTEWEMAKLRKRMKKNAIWSPSETMIRRELSEAGRGPENYRLARAKAEATGEDLIDDDKIATTAPGKQLAPGEISAASLGFGEEQLSNRGMKLNEAKKLKKENLAREQEALARAGIEQATQKLADIGTSFKGIFSPPSDGPANKVLSNITNDKDKEKEIKKSSPPKKRKREDSSQAETAQTTLDTAASPDKPTVKRRKPPPSALPATSTTTTTTTTTTTVPLAAAAPSTSNASTPGSTLPTPTEIRKPRTSSSRSRRPSIALTLKGPAPPREPTPFASRPNSRPTSRRASAPPAEITNREHLRRTSATPAPAAVSTAASRRSKRPAPGPVTSSQDGGAAVSVGRRKNAPRKRAAAASVSVKKAVDGKGREEEIRAEEEAAGEEIDPDEPRYCVCGDVSFGTMICCENADCEKEWFHLECVGLLEPPGRRTKWYCPDCRLKFGKK